MRPQAAELLGVTPERLAELASRRKGPEFVKVGKLVRYRAEVVREWVENRVTELENSRT